MLLYLDFLFSKCPNVNVFFFNSAHNTKPLDPWIIIRVLTHHASLPMGGFCMKIPFVRATFSEKTLPYVCVCTNHNLNWKHFFVLTLQGEESHGYKELVAAAKRVDSVSVAICVSKEVWADYGIKSDTITLFRKVPSRPHHSRAFVMMMMMLKHVLRPGR